MIKHSAVRRRELYGGRPPLCGNSYCGNTIAELAGAKAGDSALLETERRQARFGLSTSQLLNISTHFRLYWSLPQMFNI